MLSVFRLSRATAPQSVNIVTDLAHKMRSIASDSVIASLKDAATGLDGLFGQVEIITSIADLLIDSLRDGCKVMFCGNGGSAADSQHLAAELMGRFLRDRNPLPALALTVDTSALTAIGNDFGYEHVFARQLRGIGRPGDVLVGLSTSGNSANIVAALKLARELGIHSVGMTGVGGGLMEQFCDICLKAPARRTDHIQELHIIVGHICCGLVEAALC